MNKLSLIVVAAGLLTSGAAMASADLAQQKNCLTCHATDKKIVGPAFKEVAAKYAGNKAAEAALADKIVKGGAGVWGAVPMPPNPVSADEAKALAKYVLSVK